jgi:multidrug efflux pump subunit AcrA (membrane-fusion protein)
MSTPAIHPSATPERPDPAPLVGLPRRRRSLRRLLATSFLLLFVAALLAWGGFRAYRSLTASRAAGVPTTRVKLGDVNLTVTAKGELRGGNSEELAAPMIGEADMHITVLRKAGEVVKEGDIVLQFDTTDQAFKLKEAEADLAEAEQQVLKAQADGDAQQEENNYQLIKAKADVRQAELDCRKNRMLSVIVAKQNDLALQSAKDHLAQLEKDLANFKATNKAGVAIQEAARNKAQVQGATARKNIDAMTIHAHRAGYVAIRQNPNINWGYRGMMLPPFRVGDRVNPGMVIAEIPDLKSWALGANIGELDRGHLAVGAKVDIQIVAVPFQKFHGHIKDMAGTSGPPWDRHFECKIALDDPSTALRPGMNANVVINAETLHKVLWVPGQAVFESDGRTYVYLKSGSGFAPSDVKLTRRSESQAVVTGISEGQIVALANPEQQAEKKGGGGGALQAIPK